MTPPEYFTVSEQQFQKLEQTGRIGPYEKQYLRKDGSRIWMVFAGANLGDGTVAEFCIDTSDQKRAEVALRQSEERLQVLTAQLDDRVRERTQQLQDSQRELQEQATIARRRAEQLARLTQELTDTEQRERRRLADILHDHIQQELVAAQMQIDDIRDQLTDKTAQERLTVVRDLIDRTVDSARSLSVELVPPLLHDQGLAPALEWLGSQMSARHSMTIDIDADRRVQVEESDRDLLYHAARELLLNVLKHAGTKFATMRLFREDGAVVLEIGDAGVGFDAGQTEAPGRSYGLFSIRERTKAVGGEVDVTSHPGDGTQVTIRLHRPGGGV
jgi:signal transduction histidine kinase